MDWRTDRTRDSTTGRLKISQHEDKTYTRKSAKRFLAGNNPILILWPINAKRGDRLRTWKVSYKLRRQATKSEASYIENECSDVLMKITS